MDAGSGNNTLPLPETNFFPSENQRLANECSFGKAYFAGDMLDMLVSGKVYNYISSRWLFVGHRPRTYHSNRFIGISGFCQSCLAVTGFFAS